MIIIVFYIVLVVLIAARGFYMPEFFKKMPKGKEFLKKGDYEIYTHRVSPLRYCSTKYHGGASILGIAYLKVRFRAYFRDLVTPRDGLGIAWQIKDKKGREI